MNEAEQPESGLESVYGIFNDLSQELSSNLALAQSYLWTSFVDNDDDDVQKQHASACEMGSTAQVEQVDVAGVSGNEVQPVPLEKALANPKNVVELTVKSLSGETVLEMILAVSTPVWRINAHLRGTGADRTPLACQRLVNMNGEVILHDRNHERPQTLEDVLGLSTAAPDWLTTDEHSTVRKACLYYIRAASQRAASGSLAGDLRLWDLETGDCLGSLQGRQGNVDTIAISIDWVSLKAVCGADDGEVIVWDLAKGERSVELIGHTDPVWAVAACFDTANTHPAIRVPCALSGSADGDLRLWDIGNVCSVWRSKVWDDKVEGVLALAADWLGGRALTGSEDTTVRLWLLETGCCIAVFRGHLGAIWSVHADWVCDRFLSGSADANMKLWDLNVKSQSPGQVGGSCDETLAREASMLTFSGHESCIWAVSASWGDTMQGLSGSSDCSLRLWDLSRGTCLSVLASHSLAVLSVAADWDRMRAVSGSADHILYVWDLRSREVIHSLEGHRGEIRDVAIGVALT